MRSPSMRVRTSLDSGLAKDVSIRSASQPRRTVLEQRVPARVDRSGLLLVPVVDLVEVAERTTQLEHVVHGARIPLTFVSDPAGSGRNARPATVGNRL